MLAAPGTKPNLYVDILTPTVMASGGGAFGGKLGFASL